MHFESGIRDETATKGIFSFSQNLKVQEGKSLLRFRQALVSVRLRENFQYRKAKAVNVLKSGGAPEQVGPRGIGMVMLV